MDTYLSISWTLSLCQKEEIRYILPENPVYFKCLLIEYNYWLYSELLCIFGWVAYILQMDSVYMLHM